MKVVFVLYGDDKETHEQARMMVASAKRFGHHVIELADDIALEIDGVDEIIRKPKNAPYAPYRWSRLVEIDPPFLSVDTDVLFLKDAEDIASDAHDVVLTERSNPTMPFNSGVFWVGKRGFVEDCLNHILAASKHDQDWFADQLAMAAMAKKHNVLARPCKCWNLTAGEAMSNETRIVHFKGKRRKAMMPKMFNGMMK